MKSKSEIKQLEEQLTALLRKKSYVRTKSACRGKYRGLYDYSLRFQDGSRIWISCGWKRYETELQKSVEQFSYFRENHTWLEEQIRLMIERDNKQAATLGLETIKLVSLELIEEPVRDYEFWVRVILEQSGRQFPKLETNFNYACLGFRTDEYFTKKLNRPDEALGRVRELGQKEFLAIIFGYLCEQKELERTYS